MLYTGIRREMLRVLIPFIWTKSLSMKLPIALESKSTLTERTSLVLVVLISIGRTIDVPWVSRVLVESCLGSFFSHFGFQGRAFLSGVDITGAFIGSLVSVLVSSTFNIANLFTDSDWGTLFTSCAKQNPLLEWGKLSPPLLYPSEPLSLQSISLSVPQLTFRRPGSEGSPSQDNWPLHTNNTLMKVKSMSFRLRLCP